MPSQVTTMPEQQALIAPQAHTPISYGNTMNQGFNGSFKHGSIYDVTANPVP